MPKGFDDQPATFDENHVHPDPHNLDDRKVQKQLMKHRERLIRKSRENPSPLPKVEDSRARDAVMERFVVQREWFAQWSRMYEGEMVHPYHAELQTIDSAQFSLDKWRPSEWLDRYAHVADLFDAHIAGTNRADRRKLKNRPVGTRRAI